MKKNISALCLAVVVFASLSASDAMAVKQSALGVIVRQHSQHSVFAALPFEDDDLTYGVAFEYHEESAYWQLAVGYGQNVGAETTDYVVTPEVNLIIKDSIWRGGIGALASYVKDDIDGSDWTSLYWQFLLGVSIPVMGMNLDVNAYYPFKDWGKLGDFDVDDLDYGLGLSYSF